MQPIAYTVIATFPDLSLADEYVSWLRDGHLAAVIAGGALSAAAVRVIDPAEPIQVESRYVFANRQSYDRYVVEAAPTLRAEGLKRFSPDKGVRMERRIGEIIGPLTRTFTARMS